MDRAGQDPARQLAWQRENLIMAKFSASGIRAANETAFARAGARVMGLSEKAIIAADKRALSSVRRRFEAQAKRTIRETYNVPAGQLSGKFRLKSGSDSTGEFLTLLASTQKVPLVSFRGRWSGRRSRGATADIGPDGRKTYLSAFIRNINGVKEMLVRQFSADSNSPSRRHPREHLHRLRGPSPHQMVQGIGDENATAIARQVGEFRVSELVRQLALATRNR